MTALGAFSPGDVLTAADLNAIGTWTSYTPNVISTTGSITSYSVTAEYTQINDIVIVRHGINISNNGTGGGSVRFDLPVSAATNIAGQGIGFGWEGFATGFQTLSFQYLGTAAEIRKYDYTYPGGTNHQLRGTLIYKAA